VELSGEYDVSDLFNVSDITFIKFQTISSLILRHCLKKTKEIFIIIIIIIIIIVIIIISTKISAEFHLKIQFP
jgi:uncharacterized membrane protein